uniref:Uncharacterized protein n=1 Tax=Plectus sambesii TaxID=2011161 RepID=A0A914WN87_9BILA
MAFLKALIFAVTLQVAFSDNDEYYNSSSSVATFSILESAANATTVTTTTMTTTTEYVKILGPDRPASMGEKYSESMDPGEAQDGYANENQRVGAYWPLTFNDFTAFPPLHGERSRPPALQKFDSTRAIYSTPGVGTQPVDDSSSSGQAMRFSGDDGTGLVASAFTDTADTCLGNPVQCSLKDPNDRNTTGITLSFWLKVPTTLDAITRYILDTGANEDGQPGISITYRAADARQDDRDTPQTELRYAGKITVLVSTGSHTYKVVAQAQIRQHYWNNVAVRFSPESDALGRPYGLQVFVNGTSVGWKRNPSTTLKLPQNNIQAADMKVAVGCNVNGTGVLQGSLEHLAVWYWRLTDAALNDSNLPADSSELGELKYLDGNYNFAPEQSNATAIIMPDNFNPWPYVDWRYRQSGARDTNQTFLDDTSPPLPDDCSTEKGCSCIDTPEELRTYLHFCEKTKLVEAMIRVANKGGTTGLTASDFEYLYTVPYNQSKKDLADMSLIALADTEAYGNMIFIGSKLQESDVYNDLWEEETDNGNAGITLLPRLNDNYMHQ